MLVGDYMNLSRRREKSLERLQPLSLAARLAVILSIATVQALAGPDFVPGRVLVKPKAGASSKQMRAIYSQNDGVEEDQIRQIDVRILRVPEDRQAQVLDGLSHNPNIEFAEPD